MAADTSVVAQVELPSLRPQILKSRLAPTPGLPRYPAQVQDRSGKTVTLADPRATRALVALMDVHAVVGGAACHWGGPAAFAEVSSAVHGVLFAASDRPWHESYNFVNDAGHAENGIYAIRANYGFDGMTPDTLKGFRSIQSKLTGHGESHINPEGVLLSNGPLGSSIGQAQGLAIGDKLAGNKRITVLLMSDGASMEGEAKEAFAAIPGLAAKRRVNPFVMIISDNDTKLSGRITADSFSMQPSFEAMAPLGWDVRKIENGHDLQLVYTAIEQAIADADAHPEKPVCIWLKTIKGYGIKATEQNAAGGHGFPLASGEKILDWLTEIYQGDTAPSDLLAWGQALRSDWEKKESEKTAKAAAAAAAPAPATAAPAVKKDKVQAGLAAGAILAAQAGYPVYSVSSDVQGSTGISTFQKATGRFIEVGIAESNMISVAAGLSKVGFIPIVDTFGQFGVTKGNLPLTMAALSQAPVIAMFSHIGFQDAADGASHQATTYLAAVSSIPHTTVVAPSCAKEAEAFMDAAIRRIGDERAAGRDGESVIFFVGRENYPVEWVPGATYTWGKAQVIEEGSDVVLVGSGVLFSKCLEAAKLLRAQGKTATVINNPFINQVDIETIGAAVLRCGGRLVTIEDHQIVGGMGAQVSHALSRTGISHRVTSLGIHGEFGQSAYLAEELYIKHGMTGSKMAEAALALIAT
ncbi:MAG: thiamine pyrophosphate-dependent enzyme [Verrucomicrobia bacterium]|nr:thiamine pyrophosphate-dependent enzyme [Verrucomicrobiota bacterium]